MKGPPPPNASGKPRRTAQRRPTRAELLPVVPDQLAMEREWSQELQKRDVEGRTRARPERQASQWGFGECRMLRPPLSRTLWIGVSWGSNSQTNEEHELRCDLGEKHPTRKDVIQPRGHTRMGPLTKSSRSMASRKLAKLFRSISTPFGLPVDPEVCTGCKPWSLRKN